MPHSLYCLNDMCYDITKHLNIVGTVSILVDLVIGLFVHSNGTRLRGASLSLASHLQLDILVSPRTEGSLFWVGG